MLDSLIEAFSEVEDPRKYAKKISYKLVDILTVSVCAFICGADDWGDVVEFGESKIDWLKTFLDLENGIPSHDAFGRVFSLIDAEQFQAAFLTWVSELSEKKDGHVVPIDGKTIRRSRDSEISPVHMVSAYDTDQGLVLGQLATEEKSNEITAIPTLLDLLDIKAAIVTIDAMGAQKEIVKKIVQKEADYVIGLKANQPKLYHAAQQTFLDEGNAVVSDHPGEYTSHGRTVSQSIYVTDNMENIPTLHEWKDLTSLAMVVTNSIDKDGTRTVDHRYYFSSLAPNAKKIANAIRSHWGVENSLHWVLDVTFNADYSRARKGNVAKNLAVLRHTALNLIRQETRTKGSIKGKRKRAGWNTEYLELVLFGDRK